MNILVTLQLGSAQIDRIRAVSDDLELMQFDSEGEVLEAMSDVDVIFGRLTPDMFDRAERLRWVQSDGAGVDTMLYPDFVESDVVLTSAKGTVGTHLADHAMALLLGLARGISHAVRVPDWDQRMPIRRKSLELTGRTMGIVGLGGTGRELASRAHGFGMRIIAVDPEDVPVPETVEACWRMDRFHDLLSESDFVAICAPLTAESWGMFDRAAFEKMQHHALLINVTRGNIVDESALMEALRDGLIGGGGLDVTPQEPLPSDHPLWSMENVLITPHTAGGSPDRVDRTVDLFCDNLGRFLSDEPLLSVIDKRKGY